MEIHPAIAVSLAICVVLLIWVIGKEYLVRILCRTVVGGCVLVGLNFILPTTMFIGVNAMTLGVAGILGIPGIVLLYIIRVWL